jgi:SAM-dependent methyltransferase
MKKIYPEEIIKKFSVSDLCNTADEYFQKITNPVHQLAKPFFDLLECPEMLHRLGLLISGLRLGKTMEVLDFGAGTGWLSRFLNQLQCTTILVDPSITALNYAKKLFNDFPIIGEYIHLPRFIHFNGHTINIPGESVDRIICFDTFHHVPNQEKVLSEFFRILKPGGIAGFSEPGINHSQTLQSQSEMRNHYVLENDIRVDEIRKLSTKIGFSDLYLKLLSSPGLELNYMHYHEITQKKRLPQLVADNIHTSMKNGTVFFLTKGTYIPDSRNPADLKHNIKLNKKTYTTSINKPVTLKMRIRNVGNSMWLHANIKNIGKVNVGIHLYDEEQRLINLDFFRSSLDADVYPGKEIEKTISLRFREKGHYILAVDLVSEYVCWFENVGNEPVSVHVTVR